MFVRMQYYIKRLLYWVPTSIIILQNCNFCKDAILYKRIFIWVLISIMNN